jgi:AcrR family transcriptional regulator
MGRGEQDEEQRQRLLEGLAASIVEKGLPDTQLDDIVRHARTSKRTFYKHFPDKDACFVELANELSDEIRGQVRDAIDADADWQEQVATAVDTYLSILAADPAMTVTFSAASLGPTIVRAQRDAIEQYALFVQELSRSKAFKRAGIAPVSIERAFMLVSGLNQTVIRAVERDEDIEALGPEFTAVISAVVSAAPRVAIRRRRRRRPASAKAA